MGQRWPDFFIVGAARAGTTSLFDFLGQHSAVFFPAVKEPHFFAAHVQSDPRLYFPPIHDECAYLSLYTAARADQLLGDASPSYLWDPDSASHIAARNPHAKIIISLRNPIQRAYSHYLLDCSTGLETKPFIDALYEDQAHIPGRWGREHLYLELGLYCKQVERYLACFDRQHIKIILFDDLQTHPDVVGSSVLEFLGPPGALRTPYQFPQRNVSVVLRGLWANRLLYRMQTVLADCPDAWRPRLRGRFLWLREHLLVKSAKPRMDREARRFLAEFYKQDLEELERLSGHKVKHWLESNTV